MIYAAPCVDAGSIHYLGKWEGLDPGNLEFLGPEWHLPIDSMPFHRAQKTLDFQGPTPLPIALVMDAARIKSITYGAV
jgi:hypothetical protein